MRYCICFPKKHEGIYIFHPAPEHEIALHELARTIVPDGRPYRIIETSDLPEDRYFRAAWVADFSAPDGYGRGEHDFD